MKPSSIEPLGCLIAICCLLLLAALVICRVFAPWLAQVGL